MVRPAYPDSFIQSALGPSEFTQDLWDCFFLSWDTLTEVPCVRWEDLRVLTVLGSSCPLSGFSPVHYANSVVGAWMYGECAGCCLNFLGTAAPLWAPIQTWVSVQMDRTCITIYSELMCPSMCWPSVFPLHSDFWALRGVNYIEAADSLERLTLEWPFLLFHKILSRTLGVACVQLWEILYYRTHNHSLHLLTLTSQATF